MNDLLRGFLLGLNTFACGVSLLIGWYDTAAVLAGVVSYLLLTRPPPPDHNALYVLPARWLS
jgi:hypothetical protein